SRQQEQEFAADKLGWTIAFESQQYSSPDKNLLITTLSIDLVYLVQDLVETLLPVLQDLQSSIDRFDCPKAGARTKATVLRHLKSTIDGGLQHKCTHPLAAERRHRWEQYWQAYHASYHL